MFQHRLISAKEISQLTGLPLRSCYRLKLPWMRLNGRTKRVRELDLYYFLKYEAPNLR